jgi:membrane-associated phospholipid phosphatase
VRRFLEEHGAHLLVAAAADYATKAYSDSVGPSTDPVLFATPGALDTRLREEIAGPTRERGFIEKSGLEALRLAVPAALVGFNAGDGAAMTRDLAGYAELYFMKRAVVRLAKDLIGRERPALEFASEDGRSPGEIEALDDRDGSHQSFPSGHASGSFAWAGYLDRVLARKYGARGPPRVVSFTTLYGLAGYISWSRLRRDKHYFSDVAAGAAVGVAMSRYYYRLNHPDDYPGGSAARSGGRRIALHAPVAVPGGVAVMVGIRVGRER